MLELPGYNIRVLLDLLLAKQISTHASVEPYGEGLFARGHTLLNTVSQA